MPLVNQNVNKLSRIFCIFLLKQFWAIFNKCKGPDKNVFQTSEGRIHTVLRVIYSRIGKKGHIFSLVQLVQLYCAKMQIRQRIWKLLQQRRRMQIGCQHDKKIWKFHVEWPFWFLVVVDDDDTELLRVQKCNLNKRSVKENAFFLGRRNLTTMTTRVQSPKLFGIQSR